MRSCWQIFHGNRCRKDKQDRYTVSLLKRPITVLISHELGFLFRSPGITGFDYGLATSHDVETGVTRGLIHGLVEGGTLGAVINLLQNYSEFALHPLLIPIAASEVYLDQLHASFGALNQRLLDMELAIGQRSYKGEYKDVDPLKIDFFSLTRRLNGESITLGQLEYRAAYQQHQLQKMIVYKDELSHLPLDARRRRKENILQMSRSLKEHLEYMASQLEDVLARTRVGQRRVSTMLSVVSALNMTVRSSSA